MPRSVSRCPQVEAVSALDQEVGMVVVVEMTGVDLAPAEVVPTSGTEGHLKIHHNLSF